MSNQTRKSTKLLIVLAALALTVAMVSEAAARSSARKHSLALTALFESLGSPGGSFVATGTISGSPLGSGALVRHVTSQPSGELSVKFTMYTKKGSVSGTTTETRTPQGDGSTSFTVTSASISSGTGAYAGARGHFTGTGSQPNFNSPVTENLHGSVKY